MGNSDSLSATELKARLKELEREYELAREGLRSGFYKTAMAMVSGLVSLGVAAFVFVSRGPGFIDGWQLIVIFGIMAVALVIYYSFVFGRSAKLRAEISKTKKLIEVSSGENVRG
jgi:DNA-binding Lrp family transcriptional regulator